ncbi:MAG TPA: hypothetical protein DC010_04455 [Psychrobacter sp.]|nr:hypothetical protein [Psychrobacter sp.]
MIASLSSLDVGIVFDDRISANLDVPVWLYSHKPSVDGLGVEGLDGLDGLDVEGSLPINAPRFWSISS